MKRLNIVILLLTFVPYMVSGQQIKDLLNYSTNYHFSTARSTAMGGAFHSLGGDLSVLSENPAGIASFRTSQISFTPTFSQSITESKYSMDENKTKANKFNFGFSNIGFVVPIETSEYSDWESVNFGFAYNQRNNFNKKTMIGGVNDQTSLIDFFDSQIQGVDPNSLDNYGSRLFFDAFLMDTINGFNYIYPLAPLGETLIEQKKSIESKGNISEYDFSLGANFMDMLYIGTSFSIKSIYYKETSFYKELNLEPVPIEYDMDKFSYRENYTTRGKGFDIKIGAIVVPTPWLRLSMAFQTPTFYTLEDQYDSDLTATVSFANETNYMEYKTEPESNDNKLGASIYDYEIATPIKFSTGISTILKKKLILSFAFENLNYSNMTISAMDYEYDEIRQEIKDLLGSVQNYKAGCEMRLTNNFSMRAGYANYGNPYKDHDVLNNSRKQVYSGGIGINTGNFFLDITHSVLLEDDTQIFYDNYNDLSIVKGDVDINKGTTLVTAGFRF